MSQEHGSVTDRIHEMTLAADVPGIRLVGIDGPAGAGKSTLARELAQRFDWPVIEIDDFFSWTGFDSWWPRFTAEVIEPLRAGHDIRYGVRDWVGDEFGDTVAGTKELRWSPVVVIEGVGCTRADIAASFACRVWVDAPEPVRLERGVARDGESHRSLWQSYLVRERAFFAADGAALRAHLRVDT